MSNAKTQATDLIAINFKPIPYKRRDTRLTVSAKDIVEMDRSLLDDVIAQLSELLEARKDIYSPAQVAMEVLTTPELERDTKGDNKGKPKKNPQTGQFVAKPFDIKTQRIINRILNEIEPKLDKMGDDQFKHKAFKIQLKAKDALYFAKRMIIYFDEFSSVQSYVPDAYDMYLDLKAEATKIIESGN